MRLSFFLELMFSSLLFTLGSHPAAQAEMATVDSGVFGTNYRYARNVLQYDLSGPTPVQVASPGVMGEPQESVSGVVTISESNWPNASFWGRVHFFPAASPP